MKRYLLGWVMVAAFVYQVVAKGLAEPGMGPDVRLSRKAVPAPGNRPVGDCRLQFHLRLQAAVFSVVLEARTGYG